jgi:hypothetical protein
MRPSHFCLFCGEAIEPSNLDPCSAVISASSPDGADNAGRRPKRSPSWWKRPPGQYWMHSACLRNAAHPSVPLHFLDSAEGDRQDPTAQPG